jgi:hypothetical protein
MPTDLDALRRAYEAATHAAQEADRAIAAQRITAAEWFAARTAAGAAWNAYRAGLRHDDNRSQAYG